MNIIPKQEAQAMVASRAPQYLQSGSSVDVAAPHIGQLSVSAFIKRILTVEVKLDYERLPVRFFRRNFNRVSR
jgi:hypothetical protein